jgi:hypothetical protein
MPLIYRTLINCTYIQDEIYNIFYSYARSLKTLASIKDPVINIFIRSILITLLCSITEISVMLLNQNMHTWSLFVSSHLVVFKYGNKNKHAYISILVVELYLTLYERMKTIWLNFALFVSYKTKLVNSCGFIHNK